HPSRQDPAGGQSGGSAGGAAYGVRAGHQPEDRTRAGPDNLPRISARCRRRHRMRSMEQVTMRMLLASAIWRAAAIAFFWTGLLCAQPAASQEVRLNEVLRSLFYTPQYVAV